jgi:threonyl-tRNA synthetase
MPKCKTPFMLIVGEEEEKWDYFCRHGQEGKGNITVTIEEFVTIVNEEINKTLKYLQFNLNYKVIRSNRGLPTS